MVMTLICNEPNNRFSVKWEGTEPQIGSTLLFKGKDVFELTEDDASNALHVWRVTKVFRKLKPLNIDGVVLVETEVAVHVERC